MPESQSPNARLDSWKEIADYLKRDVRTAIRWGKDKGLPVHRVPGGKRQAVFAYTQEIDAWLGSQDKNNGQPWPVSVQEARLIQNSNPSAPGERASTDVQQANESEVPQQELAAADTAKRNRAPRASKRTLTVAAALLLMAIGVGGWLARTTRVSALPAMSSLKQVTEDGHSKGALRTDGKTLYFTEFEGARSVLIKAPASGSPITRIDSFFTNVLLQDLSKDGKELLVISYEGAFLEGPLWTLPVEGGTPRRIGEAVCNFARWSPDNSQIACAHGTALSVMNSDGSNVRNIEVSALPVGPVVWSPDGQRLRFVLEQANEHINSQWEIGTAAGQTAAQAQKLNLGEDCCRDWSWTRDGKSFLYTQFDRLGKSHLRIQSGDSVSNNYEIPIDIGTIWSAEPGMEDDSLFLLISNAFRGELLKLDGKEQSSRSYLPGLSALFVAFSPDGHWITYAKDRGQHLVAQPSRWFRGAAVDQATDGGRSFRVVARWAVHCFMACTPGKPWRLYLIGRDGGNMREMAEGTEGQGGPSWSPDGKFIVYGDVDCEMTESCWIRRLEVATGKIEIIPGSSGFRTARWSADGKYIAALRPQTHELMLLDLHSQSWRALAGAVTGDNINWSSDSQYLYIDNPRHANPVIERIDVKNGHRKTVATLDSLKSTPGTISPWFGLTPDNRPILCHLFTSAEVYKLKWPNR